MLSDVDMVFLFHFPSENYVKFFRQISCITDMLSLEVELWFEEVVKIPGFSILKMEFDEKIAFDQISDLVSRFFFNVFKKLFLNDGVNFSIESEQDCLLFCHNGRMVCIIKSLSHNHIVFYFSCFFILMFVWNWAYKYNCHELHVVFFMVNYSICLIVLSADVV